MIMAEQTTVLDAKLDGLGSIPRSYKVEDRIGCLNLSSEFHTQCSTHMDTQRQGGGRVQLKESNIFKEDRGLIEFLQRSQQNLGQSE